LEQPFIKDSDKTITQLITASVAKIGENISVRRFTRYHLGEGIEKKANDFAAEVMAAVKK
ncbi:MAG: tsf, partial [Sporomusa sp.]|nr:tsf [Sporomusa sp.]